MEADVVELDSDSLDTNQEARAKMLHEESIVLDGLLPGLVFLENPDYRDNLSRGGINAANFTVATKHGFEETVQRIQKVYELVYESSDKQIVTTADEIRSAFNRNETGVILGFQDTRPIERRLENVRTFEQLGVRIIQLTYNSLNYVGSGCWERDDSGLSHFGRDVIDKMNEHNILIDLSHCNDQTTMEAIEHSSDPVAFTHVAVRSIGHAYGRGKTDEQMKAVADDGGVIGITFHPPFVKKDPDTHEVLPATINDVLDHIDHVVGLVGVDHVGFGSDMNDKTYDDPYAEDSWITQMSERHMKIRAENEHVFGATDPGDYDPVRGLDRSTEFGNITRGLVARGYTDEEVQKIMGGNFLRLFEDVCG